MELRHRQHTRIRHFISDGNPQGSSNVVRVSSKPLPLFAPGAGFRNWAWGKPR